MSRARCSRWCQGTAIADRTLRKTEFQHGNCPGVDLRGSDLTTVIGAVDLTGVTIGPDQEHPLAQALTAAMDLALTDHGC
ncbi:hypothetical protein [Streptomyces sp. NPDC008122]|uniref:hypothetical protein n=1 Tax=Streptomyces sp. NPDC008122 TaxID=3364810 RepID=UPI0036E3AE7E